MPDYFLRDLERCFSECGSPEAGVGFAVGLQRAGRRDEGVGVLVDLFRLNPENGLVKFAWVSNFGLPFVEQNPPDAVDTVRWYNVLHKGVDDSERVPYVFTWDNYFFRHNDRNDLLGGLDCFSQDNLAGILKKENIFKRPLTAGAVHSHVLALEEMVRLGVSSGQVQFARGFLRHYLAQRHLTWTLVDYDKQGVIQDYDCQQQMGGVDIRGNDDYLINLNAGQLREGDLIKNFVLCAEQTVEDIDRMYNNLLGVNNGAYVCRPGNIATGKCAVVLGDYSSGFNIYCIDIDSRPVCLVAAQKAKDFGGVCV